jgi:Pyrimidine dimer DNA glycosylase
VNIFFIDKCPSKCAEQMVDKHVVKMILETCQLLSTCHHVYGSTVPDMLALSFRNHPCNVWVRESRSNYVWLHRHLVALCQEYTRRYRKTHKLSSLAIILAKPPATMFDYDFTCPPQCMPDQHKRNDYVLAYRDYYKHGKKHIHSWKYPATKPDWI